MRAAVPMRRAGGTTGLAIGGDGSVTGSAHGLRSSVGAMFEGRDVAAAPQLDQHRVAGADAGVILVDLGAQAAGLDPDDRIEARVVALVPREDLDPDRVLLHAGALARQRLVDDVAEKPAHPIGVREAVAGEDAAELEANLLRGRFHGSSIPHPGTARRFRGRFRGY